MSAPASVGLSIGSYLVIVFLLRWSLKRPVAVSAWVAGIHNLSLCGGSLIMFMGAFVESMRVRPHHYAPLKQDSAGLAVREVAFGMVCLRL